MLTREGDTSKLRAAGAIGSVAAVALVTVLGALWILVRQGSLISWILAGALAFWLGGQVVLDLAKLWSARRYGFFAVYGIAFFGYPILTVGVLWASLAVPDSSVWAEVLFWTVGVPVAAAVPLWLFFPAMLAKRVDSAVSEEQHSR